MTTSISYGRQSINKEDILEVKNTLKSNFLTGGPKVKEFEEKFAAYVGAKYAVAVSSGTAALHLACLAAELKENEELITSPMTFAASSNCAFYCGAKPVFVDINEQGLINENKIEEAITSRTKVIIPVHYAGLPCNMEKINEIAKKNNLVVIEDACHALGARYKESRLGDCNYSNMACFSFHPVKHITTGEGGIITTNSKELYNKLIMLRTHGTTKESSQLVDKTEGPWYYEMQALGFNYRITDIQCALGISQLKRVGDFVEKRRRMAQKYIDAFKNNPSIRVLLENPDQFNSYHLFVIQVPTAEIRKELFLYLQKQGINCQVHYIPVYWHPFYQNEGYKKGLCPTTEEFYNQIISIPIYPGLKEEEQNQVISAIINYLNHKLT